MYCLQVKQLGKTVKNHCENVFPRNATNRGGNTRKYWREILFFIRSVGRFSVRNLQTFPEITKPRAGLRRKRGKRNFVTSSLLFFTCFSGHRPELACPEGLCTTGAHNPRTGLRFHTRCHPDPIPRPVKVGHTTGVYVPYSSTSWVGSFTSNVKISESAGRRDLRFFVLIRKE